MTTAADLTTRVRSDINEPSGQTDQLRTDEEIRAWLQGSQLEYVLSVPPESLPEITVHATFTGTQWAIAADYLKLAQIMVTHTLSGTYTEITQPFVLSADEGYFAQMYDGGYGAWAQFRNNVIAFGPTPISGTITYLKAPTSLTTFATAVFELGPEHEEPVVNRASSLACAKINDADSEIWMGLYEARIEVANARVSK
jgi:hypothetical protein